MPKRASTRRRFLATALAGAVTAAAGCLEGLETGNNDDQRVLHLDLVHHDSPLRDQHVVDLSETRWARDEEAFEAALDGDRYTTQYWRPFASNPAEPRYAERDGTYYRLGSVVVDEATETRPVLRLRETDAVGDESATGVTAAERLPPGDQRAVEVAHLAARARGNAGGVPWGLVQRGGYVYRRAAVIEESRLLSGDGPDQVTYRETQYAIEVTREPFHEPVYRATVDPVATSPERMEAILRAKLVDARIDPGELSTDARDVLRQARGDGYSESHPYSSGYRAVLTALHERAYLDGDVDNDSFGSDAGTGTLRYDGEYYDYGLRFRSGAS